MSCLPAPYSRHRRDAVRLVTCCISSTFRSTPCTRPHKTQGVKCGDKDLMKAEVLISARELVVRMSGVRATSGQPRGNYITDGCSPYSGRSACADTCGVYGECTLSPGSILALREMTCVQLLSSLRHRGELARLLERLYLLT